MVAWISLSNSYQDLIILSSIFLCCFLYLLSLRFVFFIFIIPIAQIYKSYVSSICSKQFFVIKKEISTTVNLNLAEFAERFESLAPKILINGQQRSEPSPEKLTI